jgi:hypothetical protein
MEKRDTPSSVTILSILPFSLPLSWLGKKLDLLVLHWQALDDS